MGASPMPQNMQAKRAPWATPGCYGTPVGNRIAAEPQGETKFGGRFTVRRTLVAQLAELRLKPDDIRYIGQGWN